MKEEENDSERADVSSEFNRAGYHVPVLLDEVMDNLSIKANGIYVDCTFGGGGHSKRILQLIGEKGKLIAFDQDVDAQKNLPDDNRIVFIPHNFRHLKRFLRLNDIDKVDGLLADLGVSSYQFDEAERGFSTRQNALLDMRMDQRQVKTAVNVVNTYSEHDLHKLFEKFGEVTNAKTLARTIAEARQSKLLNTIEDFKNILDPIVKGNPNKYFAQVFQALRIEVNDELNSLKEMLEQLPDVLKKGGRAAIISFHSVEDRIVKVFFRDNTFAIKEDNPFVTYEKETTLKLVNKKPIVAGKEEIKQNPRSRSAKLRVAERT